MEDPRVLAMAEHSPEVRTAVTHEHLDKRLVEILGLANRLGGEPGPDVDWQVRARHHEELCGAIDALRDECWRDSLVEERVG